MKKMKVLIVAGELNLGGLENQLMYLLRHADRERFQIDYTSTTPDSYYREEIETLGGGFLRIPHMSRLNPFPYCKALYRIMKDGKYDVVHSHELFHSGIVLLMAKLAGVPVRVAHAHNWQDGDGSGKKRSLIRSIYNTVMRWLIVGCTTHQMACSSLAGKFLYGEKCTQRDTYQVVFNSINTEKILDRYDQKETGDFCDGWINVFQVARVSKVKNQLFLTDIAAELKRRGKKIRILCAGSGDEADVQAVCNAIHAKDVADYIQLLGARSDIDVLLRKAQAFVLPSYYEGMPLALIEAQASGLPCVVADTFSHEVDFEIGKVQWLPLDGNAVLWADALEKAIESGRADKALVEKAVEEKRFDAKMFAQTLCDTYQDGLMHD